MNKNKIFKNLKKLTAVSLTAANLFTFANSGSAIVTDTVPEEKKETVQQLIDGKETFARIIENKKSISRSDSYELYRLSKDIYAMKVLGDGTKAIKKNLNLNKESLIIHYAKNTRNSRYTANFEQADYTYISFENAKKVLEEKKEEPKKEEPKKEEPKKEEPKKQESTKNKKKDSFISRHRKGLISGSIIGGAMLIIASTVTIFWDEVKAGCNFVAEKAVELKNKIVKAVK